MTDATNTEKIMDGQVCSWCGTRFHPAMPQKSPVCPRCYRLLSNAGLKDEEIFVEVKPGKGETAPDK